MRRRKAVSADRCGCAMGAKFLAVALVAATAWYAWHWRQSGLTLGSAALRVLAFAFCACVVGKVVGLLLARRAPTRA
jgi:hypothetical protein